MWVAIGVALVLSLARFFTPLSGGTRFFCFPAPPCLQSGIEFRDLFPNLRQYFLNLLLVALEDVFVIPLYYQKRLPAVMFAVPPARPRPSVRIGAKFRALHPRGESARGSITGSAQTGSQLRARNTKSPGPPISHGRQR
jgi:hypothetical protein